MIRPHLTALAPTELDDRSPGPLQIYRMKLEHPEPHWLIVGHRDRQLFSLAVNPYPDAPPNRVNALMQRIASYCQETGCELKLGDVLPGESLGRPSDFDGMPDHPIHLAAFVVVPDPLFPELDLPGGPIEVQRLLGVTQDEVDLIESWNAQSFAEELLHLQPSLLTDITRGSLLHGRFLQRCIHRAGKEGSTLGQLHFSGGWTIDDGDCLQLHLPGGHEARRILNVLRGRLPFDRPLFLVGPQGAGSIAFVPRDGFRAVLQDDDTLVFFGRIHTPEIQQILSFFDPDGPGVVAQLD